MPGDLFIDAFAAEAERLLEQLRGARERWQFEPPRGWWTPRLPEPRLERVAAVDGGGGFEPLTGGHAFYVARAIAVFEPRGEPVRRVDVRVYSARDSRILDSLRATVELHVALDAVYRLGEGGVLLLDGSYRALVSASLSAIRRAAYARASLSNLYTALNSLEVVTLLARLFDAAVERGVLVAFVSKDSSYRVLKETILLDLLARSAEAEGLEELAALAHEGLSRYPLGSLREKLLEERSRAPATLKPVIDMIVDIGYRDVNFIEEFAPETPGYTIPVEIGLGALYGTSIERVASRLCERISRYLGSREAETCHGLRSYASEAYARLPSIRMLYARLGPGDAPILVELPGDTRLSGDERRITKLRETDETVLAVLAAGYAGPRFYNRWLVAAHNMASMRSDQLILYTRLFEALASARGVPLRFSRRLALGVSSLAL